MNQENIMSTGKANMLGKKIQIRGNNMKQTKEIQL